MTFIVMDETTQPAPYTSLTINEDTNYQNVYAHVLTIIPQSPTPISIPLRLLKATSTRLACTPDRSVPGRL